MTFLHAAWALLNLILIVGAFVISYRNYRDFSERFGCLPSALLILAVVSTCNGGRNKAVTSPTNFFYADTVYSADKGPHKERRIVVYGDDLYKITQSVGVSPVHNTDSLRLESTVTVSGLTLGTRWEPEQTTASLLSGRRAFYQSTGSLTWYLLGVPVYTQWKHFEGETPLDEL